jgi:quinol monooxygenase YgiN
MIILINVFTVDPTNQYRLLELLARATDEFVSRAPGFVSSTLHRSLDGTKVTMYAQWRSAEDYESMRKDPGPLPFLEASLTIAKFEPGIYEIVRTFSPPDTYASPAHKSNAWRFSGAGCPGTEVASPFRHPKTLHRNGLVHRSKKKSLFDHFV